MTDPDALLMVMGFDGEEMALDSIGFTTEGEEEELSGVIASSPAWSSALLGAGRGRGEGYGAKMGGESGGRRTYHMLMQR